jgi:hypothetical protein
VVDSSLAAAHRSLGGHHDVHHTLHAAEEAGGSIDPNLAAGQSIGCCSNRRPYCSIQLNLRELSEGRKGRLK